MAPTNQLLERIPEELTSALTLRYVALYLRISVDANDTREGVGNQETWGRAWAAEHHPGVPIRVFCDNDVSAAKAETQRPQYEALREAVRRGEVVALWCVEQSRLERQMLGWCQLSAELAEHGISEIHTKRDGSVPLGDLMADLRGAINAYEARRTRERLMDRQREDALKGRPPNSTTAYGYRRVRRADGERTLEIVPEQAEVIRWVASEILGGRSTTSIARELKERGVRGAKGGLIATSSSVEGIVTSATCAGLRVYQGQVVAEGNWPAILDRQTWEDMKAVLATRRSAADAEGSGRGGRSRRRYILSGLIVCERCAGLRMAGTRKRQSGGRPHALTYFCNKGCGTSVMAEVADGYVLDAVQAHLESSAELARALNDSGSDDARKAELYAELEACDARRAEIRELFSLGDIEATDYKPMMGLVRRRREKAEQALADILAAEAADDPDAVRHAFSKARSVVTDAAEDPDLRRQAADDLRAIISDMVESVTVAPAVRGGDPAARLSIRWR